MRAYQIHEYGGLEGLARRDLPEPTPGPREAVVSVRARAINYRDLLILRRQYLLPGAPDVVPLSDGAGEVVAIGAGVTRVKIGDRVAATYFPRWRGGLLEIEAAMDQFGCTRDGMLADFALADDEALVRLPRHLTFEEGATLPCAGVTAWSAVAGGRKLTPGQSVLTIGTGGVALFAVQFARLFGARVFSITSSESKASVLRRLGADAVIITDECPDWPSKLRQMTGGRGVDQVIETGGVDTLPKSLASCAWNAEVALVLALPQGTIEAAALRGLVTLRRMFVGSRATFEEMNRAIETHALRPVVDRTFEFDDALDAYDHFSAKRHVGKVVISDTATNQSENQSTGTCTARFTETGDWP
jgi:NADPH:quinone reductase-like Zn-dependent oxidoreductase